MKILLDTHYLLWALIDSKKLKKREKQIILDEKNDIFISTISFWEISLKYSIGKLIFENIKIDDIIPAIKKSGYNILPFNEYEAISFYKLGQLKNKDPFDRMLIWQAIKNNLYFLTSDKKIQNDIAERKLNLKLI